MGVGNEMNEAKWYLLNKLGKLMMVRDHKLDYSDRHLYLLNYVVKNFD